MAAVVPWAERQKSLYEDCHDDLLEDPEDFSNVYKRLPWLAFLQYIRIEDGTLYHGRVPRVVMIHRRYMLATASDATDLPVGYALGNVVLNEYDRDEAECGVSLEQFRKGQLCKPAILVMPVSDVHVHPDYYQPDKPPDSVALLKLKQSITSGYMTPICYPFFDYVNEESKRSSTFIVDFENDIPQTLDDERKYTKRTKILPADFCNQFHKFLNVSEKHWPYGMCSPGCGMVRGAPLVSHRRSGLWILIGMASRPVPCAGDHVWRSRSAEPVRYIHVLSYMPWITNITVGRINPLFSTSHSRDDPFGYRLVQDNVNTTEVKWNGRTAYSGTCAEFKMPKGVIQYYREVFQVYSDVPGDIYYYVDLKPDPFYALYCIKVLMPNRYFKPEIIGIGHYNMKVIIVGAKYLEKYDIIVTAMVVDATDEQKSSWVQTKID